MLAVLTGSATLPMLDRQQVVTNGQPWGQPSSPVWKARPVTSRHPAGATPVLVLHRHGDGVRIAPHAINYRANLHALATAGATMVLAVHTVGGIRADLMPGDLLIPDQLIDYTWGRNATYADDHNVHHAEFSEPFSASFGDLIAASAVTAGVAARRGGVYGCTQGPRLETAAEINRLERDGCAVVGMTAMPEAVLARELGLQYASVCLIVNPAAGRGVIEMEAIAQAARAGAESIAALIAGVAETLERGKH